MNCLDFISGPPKFFIFQKVSNKTNLGGVLFFIYILIVIFIFLFYFHRYFREDEYSFSSNVIVESIPEDEANKRKNSSYYNSAFDFSFELENISGQNISSNFFIYDLNSNNEDRLIKRGKWYKKNVDNNLFAIFYDCNPNNCSIINESDLFPTKYKYYFTIRYKGPVLDNYDKYPINNVVDKFNNNSASIVKKYSFSFNTPIYYSIGWETIEYHDQIGIFDKLFDKKKKNKYIGGSFELYSSEIIDDFFKPSSKLEKINNWKLLSIISFRSNVEKTTKFSRKEKSLIDVIANICSLSLTIFQTLSIVFEKIYSKNFDSFKILQKILNNKNTLENQSHIELNSVLKEKDSLVPLSNDDEIQFKSKEINKNASDDENLKSNLIQNKNMEDYDILDEKSIVMPRLKLFDYLLNNVYSLKNWKSIKQEVITLCKEIILKYFSVEHLLYNEIKLENLFLDYKWNNPNLKYIKNNEYIDKLKNKLNELNI